MELAESKSALQYDSAGARASIGEENKATSQSNTTDQPLPSMDGRGRARCGQPDEPEPQQRLDHAHVREVVMREPATGPLGAAWVGVMIVVTRFSDAVGEDTCDVD